MGMHSMPILHSGQESVRDMIHQCDIRLDYCKLKLDRVFYFAKHLRNRYYSFRKRKNITINLGDLKAREKITVETFIDRGKNIVQIKLEDLASSIYLHQVYDDYKKVLEQLIEKE